jgi:hypothetical protein
MATLAVDLDDDPESCIVVGGRATARTKNSTPSKVSAESSVSENACYNAPYGTNRSIDHG